MIEVAGTHNTALCYTGELEPASMAQIKSVCDREEFAGCKIRIMPDVHAGMGCIIGTTMTITDKIAPGMVGVDIGCGMTDRKNKLHFPSFPYIQQFLIIPFMSTFSALKPLDNRR